MSDLIEQRPIPTGEGLTFEKVWVMLRKIRGSIAGAVFPVGLKHAVLEAGFYPIEQTGDTMRISVPKGFVPREL